MPVSVVICGLVRSPEKMLDKLGHYCVWRKQGHVDHIIYATWIGEIDRYNGLRKKLEDNDVLLVEIEEPRLVLKGGHQLHQMTALYYGLSLVPDSNQFVLKTRVDLADNTDDMIYDFTKGTPEADDVAQVGIRNKILIENSQMMFPFLNGDAQFFGRKCDLQKLVNMSAEMEMVYNRLAVEQTFFFEPFKSCTMFQEHFYWNLPHISEIAFKREEQIDFCLNREPLATVMKGWWLVLDRYFKIGWGEPRSFPQEFSCTKDAFAWNNGDKTIGTEKCDIIGNSSFVKALMATISSEEINRLGHELRKHGPSSPLSINKNIFETYEDFRKAYSDLPSAKASQKGCHHRIIRGAAQHFFVKDELDNASTRYHEQITFLRRENDYLKKQLNITMAHSFVHRMLNRLLPRKTIVFIKTKLPALALFYARYLMKRRA